MKLLERILVFAMVLALGTALLSVIVLAEDTTKIAPVSYGVDNLNNEEGNLYIAYIGGSITMGTGGHNGYTYKDNAGVGNSRWSSQLTKRYFQKKYPNKNVIEVNAGVGGTTSDLGLFRLQKDVVDPCNGNGPDVVFVEFAANDVWRNKTSVKQSMEGIVRQLAHLPKQPVVIFVYTAAWRDIYNGFEGYLESAKNQQQVADYYGIGSVNLCEYVAGGVDIEGKEIVWGQGKPGTWTNDNTHPNDNGYTGYTDYLINQFNKAPEKYFKKLTWKEMPMSGYEFGNPDAVAYDEAEATFSQGDWVDDSTLLPSLGKVKMTKKQGATITFKFSGRSIGVYAATGNEGASANYVIDGGKPVGFSLQKSHGWMPMADMLRTDLAPGEHTITITTTNDKTFALGYFLVDEVEPDPVVTDVSVLSGDKKVSEIKAGQPITLDYTYLNKEKEEGESSFEWLVSDSEKGAYTKIPGVVSKTFTADKSMTGKYIKACVNAKSITGLEKEYESKPVKVLRPRASESFSATTPVYNRDGIVKASVTNLLSAEYFVSMITAEYEVSEGGIKKLVNVSKDTSLVAGGATVEFENSVTASSENHVLKTMIVADDRLEPIAEAAFLLANNEAFFIGIENGLNDVKVSVYELLYKN